MSDRLQDKADSLDAMRDAVVDAASFTASLWMSYLLVFFYLLVAIAGVTQQDLFLANPVQLPFLGVAVPLRGFFFLGPGVFVIIHMYILLHFSLLASKVGSFNRKLRETTEEPLRSIIRRQLPNNVFVDFLAGPRELRRGLFGFLLRLISWVSLVFGPIFLLLFFQLQFLSFHFEMITNCQRFFVVVDVLLLWRLWPAALHGEVAGERKAKKDAKAANGTVKRDIGFKRRKLGISLTYVYMAALTVVAASVVFAVATFPGETLYGDSTLQPIKLARGLLVHGQLDPASGKLTSYWTDRIVLPNFDPIDHSKFGSQADFDAVESTYAVRGRNLTNAIFTNDDFRKFDFTGSDLSGAKFNDADLREANFACTSAGFISYPGQGQASKGLGGTKADDSDNPDRFIIKCTALNGASFLRAQLQGANFSGANLQGASFAFASLQAATLNTAKLNGAVLFYAFLQDASFSQANLSYANLYGALLQGATLNFAILNNANLSNADLQGASLDATQRQGTNLTNAQLADTTLVTVTGSTQKTEEEVIGMWEQIGCEAEGAPYIIRNVMHQMPVLFASNTSDQRKLAAAYYEETCAGNYGLSDLEKSKLQALQATVNTAN